MKLSILACLFGITSVSYANPPSPREALLYWEIHANPEIHDPRVMSQLFDAGGYADRREIPIPEVKTISYHLIPLAHVGWLQTGTDVPEDLKSLLLTRIDGVEYVRFPSHPYDSLFVGIAKAALEFGKGEKHPFNIGFDRTASRGVMLENSFWQMKASTHVTYGKNPDKAFTGRDASLHALIHELIGERKFKHLTVVPEPLFLTLKSGSASYGVGFRQWAPVLSGTPVRYAMPIFSAIHKDTGYLLSLINGFQNPNDFAFRHVAYPLGLAMREFAEGTGVRLNTPHFQNNLLELDSELRPLDHIDFRDVGDSALNLEKAEQIYSPHTLASIRQKFPDLLKSQPHEFILQVIGYENLWTREQDQKNWYAAFTYGLTRYAGGNISKPEVLNGNATFRLLPGQPNEPLPSFNFARPLKNPPAELNRLWTLIRKALTKEIFGQERPANDLREIFQEADAHLKRIIAAPSSSFEELIAECLVHLGHDDIDLVKAQYSRTWSPHLQMKILETLAPKLGQDAGVLDFFLQQWQATKSGSARAWDSNVRRMVHDQIGSATYNGEWALIKILQYRPTDTMDQVTHEKMIVKLARQQKNWSEKLQDMLLAHYLPRRDSYYSDGLGPQLLKYPRLAERLNCESFVRR